VEELAEKEKYAEELADLVQTKCEVITNMERRLVQAKKTMADLKAEVEHPRPVHLSPAGIEGKPVQHGKCISSGRLS